MKTYKQLFSPGIGMPKLKIVEIEGESSKYFHDSKEISEQEFNELLKKAKSSWDYSESKEIVITDDNGKEISNVSYSDNDARTSVFANVKVGDEDFEYKQIKQKSGRLQVNGKFGTTYMLIKIGDRKSEYLDRQPDLSDELLDVRDEVISEYMEVFGGRRTLANLSVNESGSPSSQPGDL